MRDRTSGLMSGDGKRSVATQGPSYRARPRLYVRPDGAVYQWRKVPPSELSVLRTRVAASPSRQAAVRAGVGQGHGVCLAAGVSGGLKSHSVRGPGPISEGGGNASPARVDGRYGEASEARRRKPGYG